MSQSRKSFPLKNGYCHIYSDRIEIEREDTPARILKFLEDKGLHRNWLLYLFLMIALLLAGLLAVEIENYFLAAFFAASALAALVAVWKNRKVSFSSEILRTQIDHVEYRQAVEGVSRAAFIIHFRPRKALLRRAIYLPTARQGGGQIAQSAYYMMKEEGFLKTPENQEAS